MRKYHLGIRDYLLSPLLTKSTYVGRLINTVPCKPCNLVGTPSSSAFQDFLDHNLSWKHLSGTRWNFASCASFKTLSTLPFSLHFTFTQHSETSQHGLTLAKTDFEGIPFFNTAMELYIFSCQGRLNYWCPCEVPLFKSWVSLSPGSGERL